MSWVKIDDAAPEHEKLLDAGAQAAWLWVCCLAYCNRQKRRDGLIPKAKIALLYPGLGLKHAQRLVEVGLLHDADRSFAMHDYHEYQPSEDLSLTRSMAGKQGGINSGASRRSKREANAKQRLEPRPDPVPSRPEEIPLPPSEPAQSRPDRFMGSFTPIRPDVAELHEAWKRAVGKTGHKLRGGTTDLDAETLAEAIDLHGMPECMAVLTVAMADGKVNGTTDEHKEKHDSIRYIFGNEQTFARLLQAAQTARKPRVMGSGKGPLERAMTANPDTSDVYDPTRGATQ